MDRRIFSQACLLAVMAATEPFAEAFESSSASWAADLPDAVLLGQGDFRWLAWRIYHAQLWSDSPWHEAGEFSDDAQASSRPYWQTRRFVLALRYYRDITRTQFIDATMDEIKRIAPFPITNAQLELWRALLQQQWQDVKEGDELCALYEPGKGTQFYDKQGRLGFVDDADFSRAFFSIWLHPQTRDKGLRQRLLGKT